MREKCVLWIMYCTCQCLCPKTVNFGLINLYIDIELSNHLTIIKLNDAHPHSSHMISTSDLLDPKSMPQFGTSRSSTTDRFC